MTAIADPAPALAPPGSSTDRLLNASLLVAPVLFLAVDTTYTVKGWEDPSAGVLHVLGAVAYGLVVLRVASWLTGGSLLISALLVTAIAGSIGNAAYGFDTIHQALGDTALVDQSGAAVLIKPVGLLFPLSLALVALGLKRLGHQLPAALTLTASIGWPVAHIGNFGPLAIGVNALLVVAFGSVAWATRSAGHLAAPARA